MGEVWRARYDSLERDVALKLPDAMSRDPERRKRFEREAKTVAGLQHPNIVTIHSIEEAGEVHFMTMGHSCAAWIASASWMPISKMRSSSKPPLG